MLQELRSIKELPYFKFYIPSRKDELYSEWRKSILNVLTKYRSFKQTDLNERVSRGDIYICEKHYVEDDFIFTSKLTYIIIYSNELQSVS